MSTTEGTLTNTPTMEIIASGDKGIVDDGNAVVLEEPLLLEAGTDCLDPFLEGISYVTQNKLAANSGHHAFSYVLQVTERTQVEAEMQPIIGGLCLGASDEAARICAAGGAASNANFGRAHGTLDQ